MQIHIISLFPKMFKSILDYGITNHAIKKGRLNIYFWNPRDFSKRKFFSVCDSPYGGGPGILLSIQPIFSIIQKIKNDIDDNIKPKVIYLSPQGDQLSIQKIIEFSKEEGIILICGKYRGIDERLIESIVYEECSIGNYILSGGEIAAMVMIDAITRFIIGNLCEESKLEDSFMQENLLEYPNYTRPRIFKRMMVPSVLLSGNHNEIRKWRLKQSLGRTWIKKPHLLKNKNLSREQKKLLVEFKEEFLSDREIL